MDDLLSTLGLGIALALVLEGTLYALFPGAMRRAIARALDQPEAALRIAGLAAAAIGVAIVWGLRGA